MAVSTEEFYFWNLRKIFFQRINDFGCFSQLMHKQHWWPEALRFSWWDRCFIRRKWQLLLHDLLSQCLDKSSESWVSVLLSLRQQLYNVWPQWRIVGSTVDIGLYNYDWWKYYSFCLRTRVNWCSNYKRCY